MHTDLATQFEAHRTHLRNVAYRMLGSGAEAEDAVQETWLRLDRSETAGIENLGGWLTTTTARVCLDALRARKTRETAASSLAAQDEVDAPGRDRALADSIGTALLVVLQTLAPAERVAFVLHDMFELPFDEIARILERSEPATRQLASRARRRVRGRDADESAGRHVVDAFLLASREGNLDALLAVLDPEVVLRCDPMAVRVAAGNPGAPKLAPEVRGAAAVADSFKGRARGASRATIDGTAGAVWAVHGEVRSAFVFHVEGDRIVAIDLVMEPSDLAELAVAIL